MLQKPTAPTTLDEQPVAVREMTSDERQRFQSHLQLQLSQISASPARPQENLIRINNEPNVRYHENQIKFQRPFVDGDFEFVR